MTTSTWGLETGKSPFDCAEPEEEITIKLAWELGIINDNQAHEALVKAGSSGSMAMTNLFMWKFARDAKRAEN